MPNHYAQQRLKLCDTKEVSDYLTLMLESLSYSKESVIHYTFLLEEALIHWREVFPPETEVRIIRRETARTLRMELSIAGEKNDPFQRHLSCEQAEEDTLTPIDRMHDLLLAGVGSEFRSYYKKGRNYLCGSFPKTRAEARLFNRNFLLLAIPIVLQTLLNSVASYADAFMLSFLDADSMSAVSLMTQFVSIFSLLIIAINGAGTALTAQLWGKRERDRIDLVAGCAIKTALFFAVLFAVASLVIPETIVSIFTDAPAVRQAGIAYLRILAPSFLFTAVFSVMFGFFRIMGEAKAALKIGIAGCILNTGLNALLIFGLFGLPSFGVRGAAVATVLSNLFQCAASLVYNRKKQILTARLFPRAAERRQMNAAFFRQLYPNAGQCMTWKAASILIVTAYGHLGADVLAAYSVLVLLDSIISSVKSGIGSASSVMVGASLGKSRMEEALRKSRRTLRVGAGICGGCMGLYLLCAMLLKQLPNDLSETARGMLTYMALAHGVNLFFAGLNGILLEGSLRVGGDSKAIWVIDTVFMWGIMVPMAVLGTYVLHWPVLLMALLLKSDEILSFPAKFLRYKKGKWLRNLSET